jgi:DNA-binding winged helix-turn-helix (wHTH) protein
MTYRFDRFTLDAGTRQLRRDGEEIHMSPKAFELLRCLVENRARAMSRDELQSVVWPSTFVLETNLASLVAEIRRALGDQADDPIFVRTIHRFGYWFVGAVRDSAAKDEPMTPAVKCWLIWDTRQVALAEGENLVGRAPDAGVWIDARGVSRHHARIVIARGARAQIRGRGGHDRSNDDDDEGSAHVIWCGLTLRAGGRCARLRDDPELPAPRIGPCIDAAPDRRDAELAAIGREGKRALDEAQVERR